MYGYSAHEKICAPVTIRAILEEEAGIACRLVLEDLYPAMIKRIWALEAFDRHALEFLLGRGMRSRLGSAAAPWRSFRRHDSEHRTGRCCEYGAES